LVNGELVNGELVNGELVNGELVYWDEVFARLEVVEGVAAGHWIERVLADAGEPGPLRGEVLELGCGLGWDTRWLLGAGCSVTALDGSSVALGRLAAALPGPTYIHHHLPDSLPFPDAAFDAVVAGLSLHYFPWAGTLGIVQEVHRVLRCGGLLVFAVNATGDVNYGYAQGVEVEPGLYNLDGHLKRFFTEADCRRLLAEGWDLLALVPLEEQRFGRLKRLWAAAARKSL
jgi:SAM-dependent methyltransferase